MTESEDRREDDGERLTENTPNTNIITSELPGKPLGITMEVPLFLTMLGISLSGTALSNILLYRTCFLTLGHSEEECQMFLSPDKSNTTKHLEEEVQKYATFISSMKLVLESLVPAVLSFFLGVWSDTHGRKPLVVWPLLGVSLSSMMVVVFCMMKNVGPWWYIVTAIPFSLTGGYTVMFTGAFCYLSDTTTVRQRSLRMTLLEAAVSAGSVTGSLGSSYLLKTIGNTYLLLLVAGLNVFAYAFTNVCLRESLTGALKGGISTVLDISLVKEMIRECFKERPNNERPQIILLTFANSLQIFILYGLISLEYMYVREKLNWTLKDFNTYSAVNTTISFVGAFIGVSVIQRVFGISDVVFSIIALVSSAAESIIKAFVVTSWQIYFASSITVFKGLSSPLIRSHLTKMLPAADIAKVFSLICAAEGICPLLAPTTFNSLYAFTISSFPGAIYVLSGSITWISAVFLGFVQYYIWKSSATHTYRPLNQNQLSSINI